MREPRRMFFVPLFLALALLLQSGCAGTGGSNVPNDPGLIRKELTEISQDIGNAEEMLKGSRAQLQMDDSQELRSEIRVLEMELYELRAQKAALEERLTELKAEGK
jgi:hypothetical protein